MASTSESSTSTLVVTIQCDSSLQGRSYCAPTTFFKLLHCLLRLQGRLTCHLLHLQGRFTTTTCLASRTGWSPELSSQFHSDGSSACGRLMRTTLVFSPHKSSVNSYLPTAPAYSEISVGEVVDQNHNCSSIYKNSNCVPVNRSYPVCSSCLRVVG